MRHFLFIMLLILSCHTATGRDLAVSESGDRVKKAPMTLDSSQVVLKRFDREALDRYRGQRAFNYREEYEGESFLTRFWRWLWDRFPKPGRSASDPFFQYLLLIIAVAVLVYAVLKMAGMDISGMFGRGSKKSDLPYAEVQDDIRLIDFDGEIERAISNRNYKLAVRLLYLQLLRKLNDHSIIYWQPEKTNAVYIREISDTGKKDQFIRLTREFEYIWYGNFSINAQRFSQVKQLFDDFGRHLI